MKLIFIYAKTPNWVVPHYVLYLYIVFTNTQCIRKYTLPNPQHIFNGSGSVLWFSCLRSTLNSKRLNFHGFCSIFDFDTFFIHSFCISFKKSATFWGWKLSFQRFLFFWLLHSFDWFLPSFHKCLHGVHRWFWTFDWSLEIYSVQSMNCMCIV